MAKTIEELEKKFAEDKATLEELIQVNIKLVKQTELLTEAFDQLGKDVREALEHFGVKDCEGETCFTNQ